MWGVVSGPTSTVEAIAKTSVVEMEAAPPPPPPPPPPLAEEPPPPPPAKLAPVPQHAPKAAPPPPAEAPPVLTSGEGAGPGDGFASGTNKDFAGSKATGKPEPEKPAAPARPAPAPAPAASRASEVDEDELSVKPNIRCSPARIAALYPQAAIDNDAEADIPVEVVVDATGRITNPRAKIDPGFGLKQAAEQALVYACRPSAIPRDKQGLPVAARVVHTLHFQLE
ncbi:MAG: hypothetical protein JWN04_6739 [Myxococcaceae bacterium]|nr:hypothetical protein [Myxococcaceae bacterium]